MIGGKKKACILDREGPAKKIRGIRKVKGHGEKGRRRRVDEDEGRLEGRAGSSSDKETSEIMV